MSKNQSETLTRRERQIMDILHRRGRATAHEVLEDLSDPPSYSAVRALLRLLEERGHVKHVQDGTRYVYSPLAAKGDARRSGNHPLSCHADRAPFLFVTAHGSGCIEVDNCPGIDILKHGGGSISDHPTAQGRRG